MASRPWTGNRFSLLTLALLTLVTIAAWASVVIDATTMAVAGHSVSGHSMSTGLSAGASRLVTMAGLVSYVAAWVVMMVAMMLPSAAPMILLYRTVARGQAARGNLLVPTWIFVLGYLVVWAAFGGVVYIVDRLIGAAIAGDARLAAWTPYGVALLLLAAGAYQFTPLKGRCLRACQSPLSFLMRYWRPGRSGAFRMGLEHGSYCTLCCWGLMAVLVAAGAMGLRWVLVIALAVAAEKLLPRGRLVARIAGAVLLVLGAAIAILPRLAIALRG
jgi:predicted metal-binding membrane protein